LEWWGPRGSAVDPARQLLLVGETEYFAKGAILGSRKVGAVTSIAIGLFLRGL
jgi:hypothetical protein